MTNNSFDCEWLLLLKLVIFDVFTVKQILPQKDVTARPPTACVGGKVICMEIYAALKHQYNPMSPYNLNSWLCLDKTMQR